MSKLALFQFKSLKTKLLVWFLLLGVIPAAVVGYAAFAKSKTALTQMTEGRLSLLAEELSDKIDRIMFERYGDVQLFANLPMTKGEPAPTRHAKFDGRDALDSQTIGEVRRTDEAISIAGPFSRLAV